MVGTLDWPLAQQTEDALCTAVNNLSFTTENMLLCRKI